MRKRLTEVMGWLCCWCGQVFVSAEELRWGLWPLCGLPGKEKERL